MGGGNRVSERGFRIQRVLPGLALPLLLPYGGSAGFHGGLVDTSSAPL